MSFFKSRRADNFPYIKDWTSPHNELRHNRHDKFSDLIWFSPFMYKFMKVGLFYVYTMCALLIAVFFTNTITTTIIMMIIGLIFGYKTIKEYIAVRGTDINLYDMFLRDYDGRKMSK